MIGILSQSTLVRFLADHIDVVKESSGNRTLKDLNYAGICNGTESQVIQVRLDQTLLHAFSLLDKFNVNGIPVVDKEGTLQGLINTVITDSSNR
jgi:CBS domain-containing protein